MVFWRIFYLDSLKCILSLVLTLSIVGCSSEDSAVQKYFVTMSAVDSGGRESVLSSTELEVSLPFALSWLEPAMRSDGTTLPLEEIDSYNVYYGVKKGVYFGRFVIEDNTATSGEF